MKLVKLGLDHKHNVAIILRGTVGNCGNRCAICRLCICVVVVKEGHGHFVWH